MHHYIIRLLASTIVGLVVTTAAQAEPDKNSYKNTVLIANKAIYAPAIETDQKLINGWGIAIRPAGAGGHFWVTGKDTSFQYVGDVSASQDEPLKTLHWDAIKYIHLPVGGDENFATGVVFSDSKKDFVITQPVKDAADITAPAKFMFASDGGIISAWTERKKPDGTFDRSLEALPMIDESANGAQFFGLAISHDYSRLYAADFGATPKISVYNGDFTPASVTFDQPFDDNGNGKTDAGEYAPFNIQALTTGASEHHIFVTYAKTQPCPNEAIKEGSCKAGEIYPGEEDTESAGAGRLAEFTEDGKLVRVWNDAGKLSAPWGLAFAPENFGALSGMLLVANFGDGTIAALDPHTHTFADMLRAPNGKPVEIDKIWGLIFGNGASLGDVDSLYYAAGPDDEQDGTFGRLRLAH